MAPSISGAGVTTTGQCVRPSTERDNNERMVARRIIKNDSSLVTCSIYCRYGRRFVGPNSDPFFHCAKHRARPMPRVWCAAVFPRTALEHVTRCHGSGDGGSGIFRMTIEIGCSIETPATEPKRSNCSTCTPKCRTSVKPKGTIVRFCTLGRKH